MKKIRSIITIPLILLGYTILYSPSAVSQQLAFKEDTLRLGIREIPLPIRNFCLTFGEELKNTLSLEDSPPVLKQGSIENEYREEGYGRFDGLRDGEVHIECGANSITAEDLPAFKGAITFSDRFYTTSVKLLLRQNLSAELGQLSEQKQNEKLQSLSIGVLYDTTTQAAFADRPQYGNVTVFRGDKTSNPLEQALNALEDGDIEAIASDGIILRSFLLEGVEGRNSDQQNKPAFRSRRAPFGDRGFSLFPQEGPLPGISANESYGMAISEERDDYKQIMRWVNTTLATQDTEGSALAVARSELSAYDSGKVTTVAPREVAPLNPGNQNSGSDGSDSDNWMLYSGIGLFILIVLVVLTTRYRKKLHAKFSSGIGSFSVVAENETGGTMPGVTAHKIISREGSLKIREDGQGVAVSEADIQQDINIASGEKSLGPSTYKTPADTPNTPNSPVGHIDCRELVAGRDMTFIQFVQDIGLGSLTTSHHPQVDSGFLLWKSLLELKYVANDLWNSQRQSSLLKFSKQLMETRKIAHDKGDLLSDDDRAKMFDILQILSKLSLGRTRYPQIRDLQSEENIQQLFTMQVIEKSLASPEAVLEKSLKHTEHYRLDYEQIVEKVGVDLKKKLRHTSRS